MLALHYFLRDKKSLENIFANINYLDDNGFVIFTFMDQKVLDLFKKHKIKNKKIIPMVFILHKIQKLKYMK